MAESPLHCRMKRIARYELEGEDFVILEEPLYSPSPRIHWSRYRPDLLGFRRTVAGEELAVVECETRPNMKRFMRKNFSSLWFQPFLFRQGRVRRILAVPQGRLPAVDLKLRSQWEVWVLGRFRPMCKVGLLNEEPVTAPPQSPAAIAPYASTGADTS